MWCFYSLVYRGDMLKHEEIPPSLPGQGMYLRYEKTVAGDDSQGLVPFYHFKIINSADIVVGHINFRVGDTPHILNTAGHLGYVVLPEHRGSGYALAACRAIAPFVRRHYDSVILTVDPTNASSIRTIEKLGAEFLGEVDVPENDPGYATGARRKRRYAWVP